MLMSHYLLLTPAAIANCHFLHHPFSGSVSLDLELEDHHMNAEVFFKVCIFILEETPLSYVFN